MTIQINTDKSLNLHEAFGNKLKDLLLADLSDENGSKDEPDDKRCMIEARLKGRQRMAVTDIAKTYEAVNGAIDKLQASIETILERLRNY